MRMFLVPLLALVVCAFAFAQKRPRTLVSAPAGDLYIPAVLDKSVHTENAHAGDEVRLDVLESILAGNGVVIPRGAHLYGHITDSEPLEPTSESRLSIQVDRAEWRDKEVVLRAFVSGLGARREIVEGDVGRECNSPGAPRVGSGAEGAAGAGGFAPGFYDESSCMFSGGPDAAIHDQSVRLKEVKLETHSWDGSTAFVSRKRNIHLPSGLLLMLHNVLSEPARVAAKK